MSGLRDWSSRAFGHPDPGRPRLFAAPALACATMLGILTLMFWPVLSAPHQLLLGQGESPNHLWGLWVASEDLWRNGPLQLKTHMANFPEGVNQDMADPFHVLIFAPLFWLGGGGLEGAVLAWNGLYAATCILAGLGGWLLARRLIEDPMAAVVAAAAMASTPTLLNHGLSGRTEYLAGAWYALHLAFLHAHLSPGRRWWHTVLAVVTLAALTLSGWCQAYWIAWFEVPLALVFARQLPLWRTRLSRLATIAIPCLLIALAILQVSGLLESDVLSKRHFTDKSVSDLTRMFSLPWSPLNREPHGYGHPYPNPGSVVVLLAIAGAALQPRKALPWLGFGLVMLVMALGTQVSLGTISGTDTVYATPTALIERFVPLANDLMWWRMAIFLGLPFGMAAAWAAAGVGRRWPRLGPLAAMVATVAVVSDNGIWARMSRLPRSPPPVTSLVLHDEHHKSLAVLPEGPILDLPTLLMRDDRFLIRLGDARPTSKAPQRGDDPVVFDFSALARAGWDLEEAVDDRCAQGESIRLIEAGFAGVVLSYGEPLERSRIDQVSALLGEPVYLGTYFASWRLRIRLPSPPNCVNTDPKVRIFIARQARGKGPGKPKKPADRLLAQ